MSAEKRTAGPRYLPAAALPALASAALAIGVFAVSLGGTYVYDDFDVFQLDPRLRQPGQWWRYWTESYNGGVDNLYRPLVSMTYAAQWWLHGADGTIDQSDAWKYHLVNVLLHAAVAALVAELARRLAGLRVAWVAGLIFAAHPIHVEPVANIVGRAELMCAAGVLGALVLFTRPMTVARALSITGCFLVAVLSKEQGILTPALLLALAVTRKWTCLPDPPASRQRANLWLLVLLTWVLAGYIVFRESILKFWWDRNLLDWTINPLVRPDADRWTMPLALLGRYAALLVAPFELSPDYGATVIGWKTRAADVYLWIGVAALCCWLAWVLRAARWRCGTALFCLLSLAITYGLVSNLLLLIGTNFAERLMYLPSVFFITFVAMLLAKLPRGWMIGVTAGVVILFAARSITYAERWNDRRSFYQSSLRQQPGSVRLQLLLIADHLAGQEFAEAAALARRATEQFPDYWEVWIARANVAMAQDQFDDAEAYLLRAAQTPRCPTARVAAWMTRLYELRATTRPSFR